MAGHQLKKLAQSRGKVIRSSLIDLIPKHWSVYTLLFSTVFLLLFCFLLFDIRTSPTALLLHATNQLGALRAQAGEIYLQTTSASSPSDFVVSPKGRLHRAEESDEDEGDDDERNQKKKSVSIKGLEDSPDQLKGGNQLKSKDRWTTDVPTEELLAVDGSYSDNKQELPGDSKDDSKIEEAPDIVEKVDSKIDAEVVEKDDMEEKLDSEKIEEKFVEKESPQEDPADVEDRVTVEEQVLEKESTQEEQLQVVENESTVTEEAALDTVKPDGGEEGIEVEAVGTVLVEKSEPKNDIGKKSSVRVIDQEGDEVSALSTGEKIEASSVVEGSDSSSEEEKVPGSVELTGKTTKKSSDKKVAAEKVSDSMKENFKKEEEKAAKATKPGTYSKKKASSKPSAEAVWKEVTVDGQCDYSVGQWVYDENYPLYKPDSCPFVDGGFRCVENGRPSAEFQKYRWQPAGCDLPRFDPKNMLERLRGRRLAFIGDSIGRNNWESLLCMLAAVIPNKTRIYEINGEPITKHKGFLSFRFEDYDCTIEYYRSPYLVPQGRAPPNSPPEVHSTFKLDQIDWSANQWKDADIIIFNSGHWWSFEKTIRGGNYFQVRDKVKMKMEVGDAFRLAMKTVVKYVEENVDPTKTQIFWRSYAPVHFRGGTWKTGGSCVEETRPLLNMTSYQEPWVNQMISEVIAANKKNPINFLNITLLSDYRPDGHSSIWQRSPPSPINRQDCSHWCLPGVPDTWNEFLYAALLDRRQGPWGDKTV